nr:MAG TPA: hypothetical protein [Caudoviricetes sp.]
MGPDNYFHNYLARQLVGDDDSPNPHLVPSSRLLKVFDYSKRRHATYGKTKKIYSTG